MARKNIKIAEKLRIIQQAKNGASLNSLEKSSGFQRCQIRQWLKNEDKLLQLQKSKSRINGGGRKNLFPELENQTMEWFRKQRDRKLVVTYASFRKQAQLIAKSLNIDQLKFSTSWIRGVCKRNKISNRRITHKTQADNCNDLLELKRIVDPYLQNVQYKSRDYDPKNILNMDETPCYFDMLGDSTLHFKGAKSVEGLTTGHSKSRFTVVLCTTMSGIYLRTTVIFKGLKKIPKINCPKNIYLAVSPGGTMNTPLMKLWANECLKRRNGLFSNQKSLLLMDSFGSHTAQEITAYIDEECKTEVILLPPKTTSFLQPLDVSVNHPFKVALRKEWNEWMDSTPPEYTKSGLNNEND